VSAVKRSATTTVLSAAPRRPSSILALLARPPTDPRTPRASLGRGENRSSRRSGAPNSASACITRAALSGSGITNRSRSPVALTTPWAARAWAPTTRYFAPALSRASIMSRKSSFRRVTPPSEPHGPVHPPARSLGADVR
jgi:hypothetical protein